MRKPKELRNPSDPGRPGFYEHRELMDIWAYIEGERIRTGRSISAICNSDSYCWYDVDEERSRALKADEPVHYAVAQKINGETLRRLYYEAKALRQADTNSFKLLCDVVPSLAPSGGLPPTERIWRSHRDAFLD